MKQLILLLATAFLASCGSKKAITTTEETTTTTQQVTVTPETPETSIPKIETDPIEVPETPVVPEPPAVEEDIVQPHTPTEVIPAPTPVPVEEVTNIPSLAFPDHNSFGSLLQAHVTAAGNVNYAGFKANRKALTNYIADLSANMPTDEWSQNDKLSYWMNAYNAMTIDLILRHLPLESIKDIKDPWDQRFWKLGAKYYNLNEIEHQILRKMGDARIHFGINCASYSCPPLLNEAFTADKVDQQLDKLSRRFINDTKRNTISASSIEISKIFTWFAKDFKTDGSLIDFLNKYSNVQINANAKKRFKDYNWDLND